MSETYYSINEEDFFYESLEDALDVLFDNLGEEAIGREVYAGRASLPSIAQYVRSLYIRDALCDRAYEDVGEYADGWPWLSDTQKAALNDLITTFLEKECPPSFFTIDSVTYITVTQQHYDEWHREVQNYAQGS